ncbi:serine hydrolase domain-containing protein [Dyella tabacisoli]|uniref:Class A beta-lactamase-related serine hydrolase n=1 Tax=Dyella tabacisoli TaxID=2282381 RepID=A0A369UHD5_9GAMM|nr:serine hydrolase domain-containing protein [Dyella tabacisoli]RDD80164.1 class A beta-lactamase-related serine hydrolase [Dyella tabacisoli]
MLSNIPKQPELGTHKTLSISCALALMCIAIASSTHAADIVTPSDNPRRSALDNAVDRAANDFFRNRCHVGLSMVVMDKGQSYFYDYGSTSRTKLELATPQSIYELASVTKTFTATLAAQAVLDGHMSVDGDFRSSLPDGYSNLSLHGKPITLRTLVTHYSGMPRDIPDTDVIYAEKNYATLPSRLIALNRGFGRNQFMIALHNITLLGEPGTKQAYSNAGFQTIGIGLEKVYGKPFAALLRQRITQPLHMTSTGLALDRPEQFRLVVGYDRDGQATPYHVQNAGAAWGLYSSTADMAKYLRWQLDTHDPVIRLSHQRLVGTADKGDGMAWSLETDHGQSVVSHGGGSFGTSSEVLLYPEQHEGFVLLANDTCQGTEGELKAMAMSIHAADAE